ncbi:MAG: precorrin-6y C5,15-methyltransferase (decarboxylating) subunit CbiE [Acidimicrobiales bacterium]
MTDQPVHVVGLLGGRPVGLAAGAALAEATLVAGGAEQLAAVCDLLAEGAATVPVAAGLTALDDVADHEGAPVVLASGDPGFHGITRALAARLGSGRLRVHPAPSSVSLAFARLGLAWDGAVVASCHAGGAVRAAAEVVDAPFAAVLCGPSAPPEVLGRSLVALGDHHPMVAVATRLGEDAEELHLLDGAGELADGTFDHRSVVVLARRPATVSPAVRLGGRAVSSFHHRAGMITKPEVRAAVLGHLDLPAQGVLWDVGSGSGSVAIEAALAAPGLRVVAVERDPDAAAAIVANGQALGAIVEVVTGTAPEALDALPAPDRVFVGGGGMEVLDACLARAKPGATCVASFAAVDRAVEARRRLGSLAQISVGRAVDLPDGGVRFVADNPVFVAWGTVPAGEQIIASHLVVGIGCSTTATAGDVDHVVADALAAAQVSGAVAVERVATIDRRIDHPALTGAGATLASGRTVLAFSPTLLGSVEVPTPSAMVAAAVGTESVAEAAALLAAGPGGRLVVTKRRNAVATAAVAEGTRAHRVGCIRVVGLGPGGAEHRTAAAVTAVRRADAVLGYGPYVDAARPLLLAHQRVFRSAMGDEAARATDAVALAEAGWDVAVVSSGDPGVFAMASVTLEVACARPEPVAVEVVPGVTSAHAAAAAAGVPLAGPHAAITLSDLLQPWEVIERQLAAAAGSGLALALFNPRSKGRPGHLARAVAVLAEVLDAATPVVVVTDATGPGESIHATTLAALDPTVAGMRSMVLVGSADTVVVAGRTISRRHHPRPGGGS